MCGYGWTGTNGRGETIDPPCGATDPCFESNLCATAVVPANDPDNGVYTGVMLGWSVGESTAGQSSTPWAATGSGITVSYTATGAAGDVQVVLNSGDVEYCASVVSGVPLSRSDFSVGCWAGGANSPSFAVGNPLSAIVLQINGTDEEQTITQSCLDGVTNN